MVTLLAFCCWSPSIDIHSDSLSFSTVPHVCISSYGYWRPNWNILYTSKFEQKQVRTLCWNYMKETFVTVGASAPVRAYWETLARSAWQSGSKCFMARYHRFQAFHAWIFLKYVVPKLHSVARGRPSHCPYFIVHYVQYSSNFTRTVSKRRTRWNKIKPDRIKSSLWTLGICLWRRTRCQLWGDTWCSLANA